MSGELRQSAWVPVRYRVRYVVEWKRKGHVTDLEGFQSTGGDAIVQDVIGLNVRVMPQHTVI